MRDEAVTRTRSLMPYAMLFPLYQPASFNTAKEIIFIHVFTALSLSSLSLFPPGTTIYQL